MWLCFCLHSVRTLAVNDDADDEVVPVWLCYASSLKPALYTHVFRPANLRNIAHPPPQLSLLIGKRNYIISTNTFLGRVTHTLSDWIWQLPFTVYRNNCKAKRYNKIHYRAYTHLPYIAVVNSILLKRSKVESHTAHNNCKTLKKSVIAVNKRFLFADYCNDQKHLTLCSHKLTMPFF